jgi:protein tyrosine/serine phosphatase
MLPSIHSWVISRRLYRCSQPQDRQAFQQLSHLGVTTIIKLSKSGEPGGGLADSLEKAWFKGRVILSDEISPDLVRTTVAQYVTWMKKCCGTIHRLLAMNEVVCVHCTHGKDRTRAMIAAYNILYRGWNLQDALNDWKAYGGGMSDQQWVGDQNMALAVKQIAVEAGRC